jgi:hypothetical protein
MAESYWFRPIQSGGRTTTDLTQPAPGSPGAKTVPSPMHGTATHPFVPGGGLAEAGAHQEPAPLNVQSRPSLQAPGPAIPWVMERVPEPMYVVNGNGTVSATGGALVTVPLLFVPATGLIRNINVTLSAFLLGSASKLTVNVQSTYGQIYFQSVIAGGTTLIPNATLLALNALEIAFKDGLNMTLTCPVAATTGIVCVSCIWTI